MRIPITTVLRRLHRLGLALATLAAGPAVATPYVVTTTSLAADLVRSIGGERIRVESLMGPGTDPHLYKATPRDVARLRRADLLIHHGLHLEARLGDVFAALERQGRRVAILADALDPADLLIPPDARGQPDPHVWMDPQLWAKCAALVAAELTRLDPPGRPAYTAALHRLEAEYAELSAWAQAEIDTIPPSARILVASHDAYGYFGRAFGIEVVGVQGLSTVTEAALGEVARIARLIRERQLKAVFIESSVSPATIRRLSRDTGATIGGELFSDALGSPGEIRRDAFGGAHDVGTYTGMFRHNVRTIVLSLR